MIPQLISDSVVAIGPLPFLMVFIGAALQMTTGVGLGLIAGPFLLFVMDPPQAIQTAIILNLLLSAIILPTEFRDVQIAPLKHLSLWACIGIPVGGLFLINVDGTVLKFICGIVVLMAALQMIYVKRAAQSPQSSNRLIRIGGTISGMMTGALAIPGPVALWTLLSTGMEARKTRATLRAYFVVAYTLALVIHYFLTGFSNNMLMTSVALIPAVFSGMALGLTVRHRLSAVHLRRILELILFLMGASLIIKGVLDTIH